MKWLNGWSAAATFEGEFSDVTRSYAGRGVVRLRDLNLERLWARGRRRDVAVHRWIPTPRGGKWAPTKT
jgi:hypothetical protein